MILLTPIESRNRGAQLSFRPIHTTAQEIHDELIKFAVLVCRIKKNLQNIFIHHLF
mgnify:CR=1 FL=1